MGDEKKPKDESAAKSYPRGALLSPSEKKHLVDEHRRFKKLFDALDQEEK